MKFKIGEIVYLNSGSPAMTVIAMSMADPDNPMVTASWLDGTSLNSATFPPECFVVRREAQLISAGICGLP